MAAEKGDAKAHGVELFLNNFLWGRERVGRAKAAFRTCIFSFIKFHSDRGFLRASALTYTTLLSIVPLFALMFAVLKGLGVQRRLESVLLEHLTAGNQEVANRIIEYIDKTKVGSLGALGLATLLVTAVSVLGNIELSFNDIWQVRRGRTILRKISDYTALLVVGPVLLLASMSLTTTISSQSFFNEIELAGAALPLFIKAISFVAIWTAFTLAYMIMPNRSIPFLSALVGGATAGTLWYFAEWGYIRFQFGVAKYNAIYGAMAQLPVLLVWIFVSWCIVLFGAEIAFLYELPDVGAFLRPGRSLWSPRLDVAGGMLVEIARRFENGQAPPTESELETNLGLRQGEARFITDRLMENKLIAMTIDDPPRIIPFRSPDKTSIVYLIEKVTQLSEDDSGGFSNFFQGRMKSALEREFFDASWADATVAANIEVDNAEGREIHS